MPQGPDSSWNYGSQPHYALTLAEPFKFKLSMARGIAEAGVDAVRKTKGSLITWLCSTAWVFQVQAHRIRIKAPMTRWIWMSPSQTIGPFSESPIWGSSSVGGYTSCTDGFCIAQCLKCPWFCSNDSHAGRETLWLHLQKMRLAGARLHQSCRSKTYIICCEASRTSLSHPSTKGHLPITLTLHH